MPQRYYFEMTTNNNRFYTIFFCLLLAVAMIIGIPASAVSASAKNFVVVLDAGHGGKDHGAIDNGTREKDINLAVALRLGELIKKKLKDTRVVYTRDDDTFVSLQGRADIANKAKGDLFISIHTNSVDAKNKNRRSVAGASVYTQGGHKDEANLAVAKRENAVIELENGYEQKYSGFDPNKVESYIIFEMAAKHNIAQSHRFAKNVQNNLVNIAGRKDRGVHQAGFWVLWATSMPSALVELDFICNPDAAKFMSSKEGVDKLAEAIFEAVKAYEKDFRQKQKMMSSNPRSNIGNSDETDFAQAIHAGVDTSRAADVSYQTNEEYDDYSGASLAGSMDMVAVSRAPETESKDLSHANLNATKNQQRARHSFDGRRRRSANARSVSDSRNITVNHIAVKEEYMGEMAQVEPEEIEEPTTEAVETQTTVSKKGGKAKNNKKSKSDKDAIKKENAKKKAARERSFQLTDKQLAAKEAEKVETAKKNAARQRSFADREEEAAKERERREWIAEVNRSAQAASKKKSSSTGNKSSYEDREKHAGGRKSLKSRN